MNNQANDIVHSKQSSPNIQSVRQKYKFVVWYTIKSLCIVSPSSSTTKAVSLVRGKGGEHCYCDWSHLCYVCTDIVELLPIQDIYEDKRIDWFFTLAITVPSLVDPAFFAIEMATLFNWHSSDVIGRKAEVHTTLVQIYTHTDTHYALNCTVLRFLWGWNVVIAGEGCIDSDRP